MVRHETSCRACEEHGVEYIPPGLNEIPFGKDWGDRHKQLNNAINDIRFKGHKQLNNVINGIGVNDYMEKEQIMKIKCEQAKIQYVPPTHNETPEELCIRHIQLRQAIRFAKSEKEHFNEQSIMKRCEQAEIQYVPPSLNETKEDSFL